MIRRHWYLVALAFVAYGMWDRWVKRMLPPTSTATLTYNVPADGFMYVDGALLDVPAGTELCRLDEHVDGSSSFYVRGNLVAHNITVKQAMDDPRCKEVPNAR